MRGRHEPHSAGGLLVRQARLRAGMSQRQLAEKLGTSQSLVARWERGQVEPPFGSVVRAVRACGLDLGVRLAAYDREHDLLIDENLKLTPSERLKRMLQGAAAIEELRAAARRTHDG
jgi:transcriptional regulator with XRE-family HTH domain